MAATTIAQGSIVGFVALVGVIPTVQKQASWSFVVVGAFLAASLLGIGVWLWRRSRQPGAKPLGSRLAFWATYAPVIAMSGVNYFASRTWTRLAFFVIALSMAAWFYLRFVARRGRQESIVGEPSAAPGAPQAPRSPSPVDHREARR